MMQIRTSNSNRYILKASRQSNALSTYYSGRSIRDDSKIGITDTILRDAHQSLMATRMRIEYAPCLDQLDEAGFCFFRMLGWSNV